MRSVVTGDKFLQECVKRGVDLKGLFIKSHSIAKVQSFDPVMRRGSVTVKWGDDTEWYRGVGFTYQNYRNTVVYEIRRVRRFNKFESGIYIYGVKK